MSVTLSTYTTVYRANSPLLTGTSSGCSGTPFPLGSLWTSRLTFPCRVHKHCMLGQVACNSYDTALLTWDLGGFFIIPPLSRDGKFFSAWCPVLFIRQGESRPQVHSTKTSVNWSRRSRRHFAHLSLQGSFLWWLFSTGRNQRLLLLRCCLLLLLLLLDSLLELL